MASPKSPDSLDDRASEACNTAELDNGRGGTQSSLSKGEPPDSNNMEPNCVDPAGPQTKAVEHSSETDEGHSIPLSDTIRCHLSEGVTGVDSADSSDGTGRPPTPHEQTREAELIEETHKETPESPVAQAEKILEEIISTNTTASSGITKLEQQSTSSSEPVVQDVENAFQKGDGDLAEGGHALLEAPSPPAQVSGVAAETETETPEAQDSPVFLSEDGEDTEALNVDSKPLDFSSTWEQWARRDSSSSKPPTPAASRTSSLSQLIDLPEEPLSTRGAVPAGVQQGAKTAHKPSGLKAKQEGQQQVCGEEETPPMDTVARKSANLGAGSPGAGFIVLKEPLTEAGVEQEGAREVERESGQTSRDRKQRAASIHTGKTEAGGQIGGEANCSSERTGHTAAANATAQLKPGRMDVDLYDDNQSDSGVSADFSPNSTGEISTGTPVSASPEPGKPPPNETPIEREIRLAAEREQSLRQARGLSYTDKAQEFVAIPIRKPILSQALPSKSGKDKGKERQFAGKKMQHEISQETRREQDLVQLGRVAGFYEKGTVRQLRERKQLFELFQQPKETPVASQPPSRRTTSGSASDLFTLGAGGDESPASSSSSLYICPSFTERRHSFELLSQSQSPTPSLTPQAAQGGGHHHHHPPPPPACGPGLSEGPSSPVIILEGHQVPQMAPDRPLDVTAAQVMVEVDSGVPTEPKEEEEEEEEEGNLVRDNPFFKLRSSMSLHPGVEQDIRRAQERERELRRQRTSLYRGTGGAEPASPSRDIKSPVPAQPSSATAQHSPGKSKIIQPRPQIDSTQREPTEALRSPPGAGRTPRQKTPLVQRWESGMVNGHRDEED
ncbi:hypothetical protein ACEWY4_018142 [Coilia grayii]|uniref:Mitotic interactor and substrate of PLK1 n=1 Tax=Coilia grayii TaxID=363190 RepID=A0ABD1JIS9_9TELE